MLELIGVGCLLVAFVASVHGTNVAVIWVSLVIGLLLLFTRWDKPADEHFLDEFFDEL